MAWGTEEKIEGGWAAKMFKNLFDREDRNIFPTDALPMERPRVVQFMSLSGPFSTLGTTLWPGALRKKFRGEGRLPKFFNTYMITWGGS